MVFIGKPGLLCVEGDGGVVDAYMGRIKSESWSDIPSYQKKVSYLPSYLLNTTYSCSIQA